VVTKITAKELAKKRYPRVLIPGIMLVLMVGAGGIMKGVDYYKNKAIFPDSGLVMTVEDGDTFELAKGQRVKMIGINAPERGNESFEESKLFLDSIVSDKKVWLEYDRYQDDKFGRILAWVWINCETENPKFLPADYMHLDGKTSREYITENPDGCKNGVLVNRETVNADMAVPVEYEGRGRLKYRIEMGTERK